MLKPCALRLILEIKFRIRGFSSNIFPFILESMPYKIGSQLKLCSHRKMNFTPVGVKVSFIYTVIVKQKLTLLYDMQNFVVQHGVKQII